MRELAVAYQISYGDFLSYFGPGSTEKVSDENWKKLLEYREFLSKLNRDSMSLWATARPSIIDLDGLCAGFEMVLTMVDVLDQSVPKNNKVKHAEMFFDRLISDILKGMTVNVEKQLAFSDYIKMLSMLEGARKALVMLFLRSDFDKYLLANGYGWLEEKNMVVVPKK